MERQPWLTGAASVWPSSQLRVGAGYQPRGRKAPVACSLAVLGHGTLFHLVKISISDSYQGSLAAEPATWQQRQRLGACEGGCECGQTPGNGNIVIQ